MRRPKALVEILVFISACSLPSAGQQRRFAAEAARLGEVDFPVSCSPTVQGRFNTAVALLHSFQYDEAGKAFSEVAARDSHCAIAYWGKAMSLYEQLWDFPASAQLKKGHEYVQEAQRIGAKTSREDAYIGAGAAFYQDRFKLSHDARIEAYSKAMESLYRHYPDDVNAGAFYALSLVALSRNKQAIAILDKLFAKCPGSPGVDHYLIHASDSPELAQYGLAAASNYAKIAPDSAHALHMPSHIFTRLGYWQESIQSNLASASAAEAATKSRRDNEWGYQVHALTFLEYAYLQSGQDADARRVIAELVTVPGDTRMDLTENQATFLATYDLETHDWKKAASLALPPGDYYPRDRVEIYWIRTIGDARSGDAKGARENFRRLMQAYAGMHAEMKREGYKPSQGKSVGQMEAEAWLEDAEGRHDQALRTMRSAVDKEGPDGVDVLGMPAQEMLGDLLLEHHAPGQALVAYQSALKESPNRFDGLYGAARAAELSGTTKEAQSYYAKLVKTCGPDADRGELQRARTYPAKR